MRLKRHYVRIIDPETGEPALDNEGNYRLEPALDANGRPILATNGMPLPKLSHVEVEHTGSSPEQHFTPRLVANGIAEGWLSLSGSQLTIKAQGEDLVYTIVRVPGRYPSQAETSGYEVINYYDCVLNAAQHEQYRVQKGRV